jgi:hypothetical protein
VTGLPQYKPTIGELVPADDLREKMLFYRLPTTWLLEAAGRSLLELNTLRSPSTGDLNFRSVDLVKAHKGPR